MKSTKTAGVLYLYAWHKESQAKPVYGIARRCEWNHVIAVHGIARRCEWNHVIDVHGINA